MPERVLAEGSFDGVAAAAEGPPLAYASRSGQGVNTGQAWDLAAGSALGPPIPDFPVDRAEWAFGVPAGSPVVAWTHRDRVHVLDLRTGDELTLDGRPDLLGLAVHHGRAAVVAASGPANDAEVVVWDALTGERLADFTLWLGHRTALGRWMLHTPPATGPLIGLPGDSAVALWDVERGEEIAAVPPASAALTPSPDGLVLIEPAPSELRVLGLDGDRLTTLPLPAPSAHVAAASAGGRLLVAAALRDASGTVLVWDAAGSVPSHRVEAPAHVNDLAISPDGTLLAATDAGLLTVPCG
ncbi:WD40 repeat domain-containing protein [Actinomadura welshii]|uniref:WD40 repeat domain-containing protein n=1 Tax=Actinomadura welshii TaxID=3103817 RepID=UPI0003AD7318|nr:hypothetical protein [Actinomadura madurae]